MAYAEDTKVPVSRSRYNIEYLLNKYGATGFLYGMTDGQAIIMFEASGRRIKFSLRLPDSSLFQTSPAGRKRTKEAARSSYEKEVRRLWRSLELVIKAKLEAIESGIATFEDEFLAYVVLPDGSTVGKSIAPAIESAYQTGQMVPLLPE